MEKYNLTLFTSSKKISLPVDANDSNHAQAQSADICRSLCGTRFELTYGTSRNNLLSELFKKLAFNSYSHDSCSIWEGKSTNNSPCVYVLGTRLYVKNIILRYLDIPTDSVVKPVCKCQECVNPYHFMYTQHKNSRLTTGDIKLLEAYSQQGVSVNQIAKALNVHRSTIFRKLKKVDTSKVKNKP